MAIEVISVLPNEQETYIIEYFPVTIHRSIRTPCLSDWAIHWTSYILCRQHQVLYWNIKHRYQGTENGGSGIDVSLQHCYTSKERVQLPWKTKQGLNYDSVCLLFNKIHHFNSYMYVCSPNNIYIQGKKDKVKIFIQQTASKILG